MTTKAKQVDKQHEGNATFVTENKVFHVFILGEENSPGWLCGEDEGRTMVPLWCPLLACHMPVFATKSPERKVSHLPTLQNSDHKTHNVSLTCVLKAEHLNPINSAAQFKRRSLVQASSISKIYKACVVKRSVNTREIGKIKIYTKKLLLCLILLYNCSEKLNKSDCNWSTWQTPPPRPLTLK